MNVVAGSYIAVLTMALALSCITAPDRSLGLHGGPTAAVREIAGPDTTAMMAEAGRLLFHAGELSNDGELSCATCHMPSKHFQDGYEVGLARIRKVVRNTPTLLNVNRYRTFFWDGRAASLHDQITEPLFKSKVEMLSNDSIMGAYVRSVPVLEGTMRQLGYRDGDAREFVLGALEGYMRSIATTRTRYDDHLAGTAKLTEPERRGLELFNGKAQCASCHPAPDFTDNLFHDNGLYRKLSIVETYTQKGVLKTRLGHDYGRGNIVEGMEQLFRFRTPSLYNVALTPPYMHNGTIATLDAVLDFYDRGGDEPDAATRRLDLTRAEKDDLVAFLKTLTDVRYAAPETAEQEVSVR